MPNRRLVLVDIENLVGGSGATAAEVERALAHLRHAVGSCADDVWVVACGPTLLATATHVFRSRVLLGRGVNGADDQLVQYMHPEHVVGRYTSVALASADAKAFAAPVERLAGAGVPTDLYIGSGYLGHALAATARSINSIRTRVVNAA